MEPVGKGKSNCNDALAASRGNWANLAKLIDIERSERTIDLV